MPAARALTSATLIEPLWRQIAQANHLPADRYILRVLPLDELNAFACGGHLVVVTTFAIEELPAPRAAGVLAHELSHHLGMHTVALTIRHWLSLPVVLLARIGFLLRERRPRWRPTPSPRSRRPRRRSAVCVAALLTVLSWPFVAALYLADSAGNVVGHRSEFQADRRVVRMGYGRNLSAALRRVIASVAATAPSAGVSGWRRPTRRRAPAWRASTPCCATPPRSAGARSRPAPRPR